MTKAEIVKAIADESGIENSYNLGDLINKLSIKMLDSSFKIAQYGASALQLRQKLSFFDWQDPKELAEKVDVLSFGDGLLIRFHGENGFDSKEVDFLYNPEHGLTEPINNCFSIGLSVFGK